MEQERIEYEPERRRGRPFPVERGYVGAFLDLPPIMPEENVKILLGEPDKIYRELQRLLEERQKVKNIPANGEVEDTASTEKPLK